MLGRPLFTSISAKTCNSITQPHGYEHAVNALDRVTYARHHGMDLLSQVVLSVQTEILLLLELL